MVQSKIEKNVSLNTLPCLVCLSHVKRSWAQPYICCTLCCLLTTLLTLPLLRRLSGGVPALQSKALHNRRAGHAQAEDGKAKTALQDTSRQQALATKPSKSPIAIPHSRKGKAVLSCARHA